MQKLNFKIISIVLIIMFIAWLMYSFYSKNEDNTNSSIHTEVKSPKKVDKKIFETKEQTENEMINTYPISYIITMSNNQKILTTEFKDLWTEKDSKWKSLKCFEYFDIYTGGYSKLCALDFKMEQVKPKK